MNNEFVHGNLDQSYDKPHTKSGAEFTKMMTCDKQLFQIGPQKDFKVQ